MKIKIEISYLEEENKTFQIIIRLLKPVTHHIKKSDDAKRKYKKARIFLKERGL